MNKFIKVCLITGTAFIVSGMILGFIGVSLGGVAMANGTYSSWDGEEGFDHEDSFEKAERIKVEVNYGTVILEPYEGKQIVVNADGVSRKYICSLAGGLLKIEDDKRSNGFFLKKNRDKKVIIRVPEEMEWQSAELSIGAGRMVLDELKGKKVQIQVGAGELYGDKIQVLEELELSNGVGSVTLEEMEAGRLSIDNGIGEIKADGKVNGDTNIKNGIGSILLAFAGRKEDYNYKVNSGIGSVRINDYRVGELAASANVENGSQKTFYIDCGIGEVDLYLE